MHMQPTRIFEVLVSNKTTFVCYLSCLHDSTIYLKNIHIYLTLGVVFDECMVGSQVSLRLRYLGLEASPLHWHCVLYKSPSLTV